MDESKKPGNRKPKPFYFDTDIAFLLQDNAAFKSPVAKSSFGLKEINNNEDHQVDINDHGVVGESKTTSTSTSSTSSTPSCINSNKKCTTFSDELMEYFEQKDEKILGFLKDVQ